MGGYLISCWAEAGYYRLYNLLRSKYRDEYVLSAWKKEICESLEAHPYASAELFPPWTGPIYEEDRVLVKPSNPRFKRTVGIPSNYEYKVNY